MYLFRDETNVANWIKIYQFDQVILRNSYYLDCQNDTTCQENHSHSY